MPADRGAEGDRVKTTEAAWFTQAPRAVVDTWALVGSALRDGQAGAQPRDPKTLSVVGGRAGLPGAPLCLGLVCSLFRAAGSRQPALSAGVDGHLFWKGVDTWGP